MDVTKFPSNAEAEMALDILAAVGSSGTTNTFASSLGGAFEGASQFDQWLATWQPSRNSADVDLLPIKGMADARVRDLSRNDGYIQSGENLYKDGIVGSMYLLNAKPDAVTLFGSGGDDTWEEEMQQEVEAKFTLAAESPNCWLDASRSMTFTGMVRLAVGIYGISGEVLAAAEWLREKPRPFKTAIQMVDLDRLSNPTGFDGLSGSIDGRIVRGGIHQNERGAPLGYYIRKAHMSDWDRPVDLATHQYVPAYKPWGRAQIIHLKDQRRAAQSRAVSQIVAGLKEIKITKKFRDITLQQAVVNAMYAASIESDLPPEAAFASIGATGTQAGLGAAMAKYGADYMAAVSKFAGDKGFRIDNVKIPHFFPGTRLNLRNSGAPGGVGQEFEQSLLRYIAAILGVSYEELSKDFSKTNYSSARAAMLQTWKYMQARKAMVADRFASMVYMLWFEEMMNAGQLECMKFSKAPNFYEGLNAEAYCKADWIGAARGQIDELKETQAAVLRIKFGLSTHEDELAKLGKDWRAVYRQLERERKEREKRGIILVEDNSMNAASGSPREQDSQNTEGSDAREAA